MKKMFANKAVVTDVRSIDVSNQVETDDSAHTKLGWWIVLAGVGGFILWATFAPLDQGVPLSGSVMVATNRKAIAHQTGGIIDHILVKDGDVVKAGQVLVQMNNIQAKAQAEMSRTQLFTARAAEARLIAERDGKTSVAFPPELLSAKADPRVASHITLQNQLFTSRQAAVHSDLAATDENIAGLKTQLHGLEESRDSKKEQLKILKEQVDGMRDLSRDGYIARNRLLDLERNYAQMSGAISEDIGNIGRNQRQIAEYSLRRIQRQQEYQRDVRQQLADVQREAEAVESRLVAQDFDVAGTLVKSPVDGTVVGVNVFTNGGVVAPGFRMMEVVPSNELLVVEGMVPVNLIDKVRPGLKVEFIFSAFNTNRTPHVPGIVTQVSADRLVDEKTGQPYYKLKAEVAPEGRKLRDSLPIRSGMPVEIFVKTGERSLMSYLFKPVFDRAKTSMSEE